MMFVRTAAAWRTLAAEMRLGVPAVLGQLGGILKHLNIVVEQHRAPLARLWMVWYGMGWDGMPVARAMGLATRGSP
jgi:hypothetical protein